MEKLMNLKPIKTCKNRCFISKIKLEREIVDQLKTRPQNILKRYMIVEELDIKWKCFDGEYTNEICSILLHSD